MDTLLELPATATGRKRWSRDDCRFLENAGLLKGRYELIDGEIIVKMGQNPPHAMAVMRVIAYLLRFFHDDNLRTQATMEVQAEDRFANRPEPDVVALREMADTVPTGEDILLAVEVSDSTQADDLGRKVALYARAGVAEYWVLDLQRRVLIAFQTPQGNEWQTRAEYAETDTLAPLAAPEGVIRVADLLPSVRGTR
jgi:Uma2 family endonuclease